MAKSKTVFVLGAGFSIEAGGPTQATLTKRILSAATHDRGVEFPHLGKFLRETLKVTPDQLSKMDLEDLYTPIDRCIAESSSFKGVAPVELESIRYELGRLIAKTIGNSIEQKQAETPGASSYIDKFANHLVKVAAGRKSKQGATSSAREAKAYDPFSVISLNWDILLDNALHRSLLDENPSTDDYDSFGVVDYCCYVSSFKEEEPRIRSGLWTLGCGGFNVKLLKLHGSLNWLQCQHCQRMFVDFGDKVPMLERPGNELCRHCFRLGFKLNLQSSLVMPTFLKDLTNFQLKLIWQNAALELMEADKVIFVGYSLPQADFEFKQLLSRMVRDNCTVEAVLYAKNNRPSATTSEAAKRYKAFFGKKRTSISFEGAARFVDRLVNASQSNPPE